MGKIGESLVIPFLIGHEGEEEHPVEVRPEIQEETYQGTVANVRYNHMAFPWDAPLSFGVQAFVEYNGLIMNDRYRSDVIRVTRITGLDDAEVRDAREVKSGASGEFAYDSFYGGRNIVLNGFIEAGSPQVLTYLTSAVRAAFGTLEESQLKFRWFDINDSFDDPRSIKEYSAIPTNFSGNYLTLIGNNSYLGSENGQVFWTTANKEVFVLRAAEKRTFCDFVSTLSMTIGSETFSTMAIICSVKDKENYLKIVYEQHEKTPKMKIVSVVGGEAQTLPSTSNNGIISSVVGQNVWIVCRKEGNDITAEFWNEEPSENKEPKFFTTSHLFGKQAELFGDAILGQVGFGGLQKDLTWRVNSFKIDSLYPGDIEFQARKINSISIVDEQTSLSKYKRAFQIPMRTSEYRAIGSEKNRHFLVPTNSAFSFLGRKYPRNYPLGYRYFSEIHAENNIISINNRGSIYTEPVMVLNGPAKNIVIANLTNGERIEWTGEISSNDYIVIDCKEETIVNSLGENYLEPMTAESQWIKLEPKWNDIFVGGTEFEENVFPPTSRFMIYFRNSWI